MTPSHPTTIEDGGARTGRPRDEARELAILDATFELIAEVGYDRLTIDAVAGRAKASKATIYRRWPGKADLVVDMLQRRVSKPICIPDLGSLRAELLAALQHFAENAAGVDGRVLCGVASAAGADSELAACFKASMEHKDQSPAEPILARAVARGELPEGTSLAALEEVAGPVIFMQVLKGDPLDRAFIDHLVDDIVIPVVTAAAARPAAR